MGCIKQYEIHNKGEIIEMGSKKSGNQSDQNDGNILPNEHKSEITREDVTTLFKQCIDEYMNSRKENEKVRTSKKVVKYVLAIIATLGLAIFTFSHWYTTVGALQESVDKIETGLNGSEGIYARLLKLDTDVFYLNNRIDKLENPAIRASSDLLGIGTVASMQPNDTVTVTEAITADTYIGADSDGEIYYAKDIVGQTVLLTYIDKQENVEVYFLGQFNENYHWDGYCVTNAYYLDGTLYGICESDFNDGNRLNYTSIVHKRNETYWTFSDKECRENEGGNLGINIDYTLQYDKVKNFTETNVRVTDIMYTGDFIEKNDPVKKKYYHGFSNNGLYNDTTGNACSIEYDTDGTITLLYVGCFENGTFNDETGNAWEIVYSTDYNAYYYNTGQFHNGTADKKAEEPLKESERDKIITNARNSEIVLDDNLEWK
ncbi:MAG: hypothetical protein K2N15_11275 [Lachnospiraceae bacterium]|nr:hypothetical protein [Lachnospiraceae bacterium]